MRLACIIDKQYRDKDAWCGRHINVGFNDQRWFRVGVCLACSHDSVLGAQTEQNEVAS